MVKGCNCVICRAARALGNFKIAKGWKESEWSEMTFYVYILGCADGSFYTGYASNLERRLQEHNDGRGAKYVKGRLPAELVYCEEFNSRGEAMRREREIKKLGREGKKMLVSDQKIYKL